MIYEFNVTLDNRKISEKSSLKRYYEVLDVYS